MFAKSERTDGTFSRAEFIYDRVRDLYVCLGGRQLRHYSRQFAQPRIGVDAEGLMRYRANQQDCNCELSDNRRLFGLEARWAVNRKLWRRLVVRFRPRRRFSRPYRKLFPTIRPTAPVHFPEFLFSASLLFTDEDRRFKGNHAL